MAQQARPHWYAQREYVRDVLRSLVSDLGILPLSTRPISRPSRCRWPGSQPTQDPLAPGGGEAQRQHEDEDAHLDHAEPAVGLEPGGPREDEHRLDVEHDEQDGEDEVADLRLGPADATRVDAALVVQVLLRLGPHGPQKLSEAQRAGQESDRNR